MGKSSVPPPPFPNSPQPRRRGFTRTTEWQSEAARKDASARASTRGESPAPPQNPQGLTPVLSGLRDVLQRKDSSMLRKHHFIELGALWGYKSDVWRLRSSNTKRSRAERTHQPPAESPRPLLSPPPSPLGRQLPDGLEAQLKTSAGSYMDSPAGEQAYAFLRNHAAIPCELLSSVHIIQAELFSTHALADRATANLALLRSATASMTAAELAEPFTWMARSQELSRQIDEHLMMAFAGVIANGTLLRTALEAGSGGAGTVCDQAYLTFLQQSNGALARFLCHAQSAMALMRQDTCGRFFACCCLIAELLVDVLGFQVAMMQLQLSCVEEREASAQVLYLP